jgi:hypothetical protein
MKRVCLVVAIAACSKPGTLVGEKLEADVPAGWRLADTLSAEVGTAFPEVPPIGDPRGREHAMRRRVLERKDQQGRLPGVALYEVIDDRAPEPGLPAPQANLLGTLPTGMVAHRPSVEGCRELAERFGLQVVDVAAIDRGELTGCDLRLADGLRRVAVIGLHGELALIACNREATSDPDLDRACDHVVGSVRRRSR